MNSILYESSNHCLRSRINMYGVILWTWRLYKCQYGQNLEELYCGLVSLWLKQGKGSGPLVEIQQILHFLTVVH